MSTLVDVTVLFHSPFHVDTGNPTRGLDSSIDPDDLLPASSLKGAMRNSSSALLGHNHPLVRSVFGIAGNGSPWSWGPARFAGQPRIDERSRIAVGPRGVVEDGALLRQEVVEASSATFQIVAREPVPAGQLGDHLRLLAVAARLTRSLGADRNRGYGWVSMSCAVADTTDEQLVDWAIAQRSES